MKKVLSVIFAGLFIFTLASPIAATVIPTQASAASSSCDKTFLGVPPWYRGLTSEGDCTILSPDEVGGLQSFIWRIVLNVIQMALVIVMYIAIFFILYGGFLFIAGGNNPAQVENGRKSIFNAVIGLVISLGAIAITNYIFTLIGSASTTSGDIKNIPTLSGEQLLQNGLNLAYFIAGTLAVIVIIIAGIFYVTSAGDAGKVTRAKNMLTYSIVGLIIILTAFAITNFVIGRFS